MAQNVNDGIEKTVKDNAHSIILGALVLLVGFSVLTRVANKQKAAEQKKTEEAKQVQQQTSPTAKVVEGGKYTVQKGDTMWSLSQKYYQNGYAWSQVAKENKLANPNRIEVGQVLTMPKLDTAKLPQQKQVAEEKKAAVEKPAAKVTLTGTSYKVVKGDTLWSISVRAYGDGYGWTKLWKASKLKNPHYIEVGQTITIPR